MVDGDTNQVLTNYKPYQHQRDYQYQDQGVYDEHDLEWKKERELFGNEPTEEDGDGVWKDYGSNAVEMEKGPTDDDLNRAKMLAPEQLFNDLGSIDRLYVKLSKKI
jgi:hypothetical protein